MCDRASLDNTFSLFHNRGRCFLFNWVWIIISANRPSLYRPINKSKIHWPKSCVFPWFPYHRRRESTVSSYPQFQFDGQIYKLCQWLLQIYETTHGPNCSIKDPLTSWSFSCRKWVVLFGSCSNSIFALLVWNSHSTPFLDTYPSSSKSSFLSLPKFFHPKRSTCDIILFMMFICIEPLGDPTVQESAGNQF